MAFRFGNGSETEVDKDGGGPPWGARARYFGGVRLMVMTGRAGRLRGSWGPCSCRYGGRVRLCGQSWATCQPVQFAGGSNRGKMRVTESRQMNIPALSCLMCRWVGPGLESLFDGSSGIDRQTGSMIDG